MMEILLILILTSISCGILGIFLILRKLSMLTDAISHTVLLGIVLSFFLVKDLSSPFLIFGAAIMGVITVYLVETLGRSKFTKRDDAIGVVFTILFSIAIILISKFFRNVHLDTDVVLVGEVLFSSLNKVNILGMEISKALFQTVIMLSCIILFLVIFYRNLKIATFNEEYARLIGINVSFLFYLLMIMTSFTSVISFNSVGTILVVSFFITPPATALLFTKSLFHTIILSCIISVLNCTLAYFISFELNVSISGVVAVVNTLLFVVSILYTKLRRKNVN